MPTTLILLRGNHSIAVKRDIEDVLEDLDREAVTTMRYVQSPSHGARGLSVDRLAVVAVLRATRAKPS